MVLYCSGYRYCTTSFNKARTQVLRRFKSYSRRVGDSRWWGSLTVVPAGNKAYHLSSVNHTTKTIHHHHHHHHHHQATIKQLWALKILNIEPNFSTYIISVDDKLRNRCFLVALCCLIVRRPNLEVVIKRLLHQQVKILG